MVKIITGADRASFAGCDFVVQLGEARKTTPIRLLQLTDMQLIDAAQRRTPDRLGIDEINAWKPEYFDAQCGDHIRSLVAQTQPDLIFMTGDLIYGSFDDRGTSMEWFCRFMDSLEIPWLPVFGNHDNESRMGVEWQCEQFQNSRWCVFARGTVTGNSNYTVGIACGDELVRVLYMTDSNGCHSEDPAVVGMCGIYPDQAERIRASAQTICAAQGRPIPAFMAFHIPVAEFAQAERAKGYRTDERECYTLGVEVPARDGDFGGKHEPFLPIKTQFDFKELLRDSFVDGVFAGHCHNINTCISYESVRWVFGLKTGQYDYHGPGQLGGTLVTLENEAFSVRHVPSLVPLAPFPGSARMFQNFFAEDRFLV